MHLGDLTSRNNLLEHDGEFFERFLGHTSSIAGLDLLFQIVFHTHGKLIQLIPLLGKVNGAVFSVPVQEQNTFSSIRFPTHGIKQREIWDLGIRQPHKPQQVKFELNAWGPGT